MEKTIERQVPVNSILNRKVDSDHFLTSATMDTDIEMF